MHTQSATNRWVLVALLWSGGASDCGGSRTQRWDEISLTWISSSLCILFIYSPSGALSPNTSSITYLHLCLSAFRSVSQSIDPGDLQRISCCTEVKKNLCILVLCSFFFFSCISRASLQLLWIQSSKWSAFVPPQASMCPHRLCSNCAHICESRACTGEKSSGWCTQKTLSAVALRQLSCLAGAASSRYHQRQASLHRSGAQEECSHWRACCQYSLGVFSPHMTSAQSCCWWSQAWERQEEERDSSNSHLPGYPTDKKSWQVWPHGHFELLCIALNN